MGRVSRCAPCTRDAAFGGARGTGCPGRSEPRRLSPKEWIGRQEALQIVDEISGSYTNAEAWFHLHPRLRPRTDGPDTVVLTCDEVELATCQFQAAAAVEVVPDTWQPAFGVRQPSTCIRVRLQGGRLVSTVRWGAAA